MIKPEFWADEKVNECSVSARLLFIATWNFADDEGNLIRSAKQIKAQAFPYDNVNCEPLIKELIAQGLLIEYSVSEKFYLHIPNFKKHQIINRPSKAQCPLYDYSLSTHPEVNKEVSKDKEKPKAEFFDLFWSTWPSSTRKESKSKCLEVWIKKNLDQQITVIISHVEACKNNGKWQDRKYIEAPLVYLNNAKWDGAELMPNETDDLLRGAI